MPVGDLYIVDDDHSACDSLVFLAKAYGYKAYPYYSSCQFLDEFTFNAPCCVISDIRMPIMDGITLLEKMKERFENLPIILVSGHADTQLKKIILSKGGEGFFSKPIDYKKLFNLISRLLKNPEGNEK